MTNEEKKQLLEDFTEYVHTRYLGFSQNKSAPDGYEYSYDTEIVCMIEPFLEIKE